jgi:transcriptional regulator with XRE-family HTH domain
MPELSQAETASRELGRRIRAARIERQMKLSELAELTKLSESFLSRLERGHSSTSIANLIQITEVLGLGLDELFVQQTAPVRTSVTVHRSSKEMQDVHATGYRWRHLAGGAHQDRMEVFHLIFPLREKMKTMVSHPGQEHCFVLSGEINFYVGDEVHRLKAGDGIFIDSQLPHRAENAARQESHMLMAVSKTTESSGSVDWWRLPSVQGTPAPQKPGSRKQKAA